ncbi:MAG TPA: hypothetical protein VD788_13465, partial [Candidatus Polarisedimenticolaceae bacterium]|nr:hypothetical protein [Candidatus Polarisedimenticolaceae bacterium]
MATGTTAVRRAPGVWVHLGLVSLAALPYLGMLSNPLVYDAPETITRNEAVQHGRLGDLLRVDFWGDPLDADFSTRSYRPLVSLTFALQVRAGAGARALHLADLALHALSALLVMRLIERLGVARRWAFAGAAVFAVHPVQSEAVASVVGRADLMAGACLLGALLFALGGRDRGRRPLDEAGALTLLGAALFCKEYAVVFPFVLIAVDLVAGPHDRPRRFRLWAAALGWVAGYLLLRRAMIGDVGGVASLAATDHPLFDAPLSTRVAMALRLLALVVRLLVWPTALNHHYRVGTLEIVDGLLDPLVLAGASWVMLSGWFAWRRLARGQPIPTVAFVLLWWPLLPSLNLVSLAGVVFAERFLYVPLA